MTLVFLPGRENKEFWDLLETLRTKAKAIDSNWSGDMYKTTYELDGKTYIYKEDMELGIPYTIDVIEKGK